MTNSNIDAAERPGFAAPRMSRLAGNQDIFTFDRLVDEAARIGLTVRMTAMRPTCSLPFKGRAGVGMG